MKTNIKLIKKEVIANNTMAFYFEKPADFTFRAGQFADYTLIDPPETDAKGNTRGFSLAEAPFEEYLIGATRMRDTAYKRVLKDLPIGTEVVLDAAYGNFTLHKDDTIPAIFIVGGIGVAPVRSMIAQALFEKTKHELILFHASHTPDDLPFMDDLIKFSQDNFNFKYIPVVSSFSPENWSGEEGHISYVMIRKYVPDLNIGIYYLSGPKDMVKAMRELLININVSEDHIRTEEFSGY